MNDGNTALAAHGCVDDRHCALDLVRQPELQPSSRPHAATSMHAEVQKALSCAQLPTLDGSWRKKAVRVWHFFVFPQLISANLA
jgi:hypothetical protein